MNWNAIASVIPSFSIKQDVCCEIYLRDYADVDTDINKRTSHVTYVNNENCFAFISVFVKPRKHYDT